ANGDVFDGAKTLGGLRVVDISVPTNPVIVGSFLATNAVYSSDVKVAGTNAYLAIGQDGFLVLNISDPTKPSLILPSKPWLVFASMGRWAGSVTSTPRSTTPITRCLKHQ